jgi:hypothetical protein
MQGKREKRTMASRSGGRLKRPIGVKGIRGIAGITGMIGIRGIREIIIPRRRIGIIIPGMSHKDPSTMIIKMR